MKITNLELSGAKIIEPDIFPDHRGYSYEAFSAKVLREHEISYPFLLDYEAMNLQKNTLRGIHFQNNPHAQTKLVRVLSGEIVDVIVDLRRDSPTFKKWDSHIISAENQKQILIPNGFGHAFLTRQDKTVVLYKFSDYYNRDLVRAIRWDDPEIAIDWSFTSGGGGYPSPIVSTNDQNAPLLCDSDVNFTMKLNGS